jgi:hypothetical protein
MVVSCQPQFPAVLLPGKQPSAPIEQEAEWSPTHGLEKTKISYLFWESNPYFSGLPARNLVATPTGFCQVYTGFQLKDLEGPLEAVHSRSYFTVVLSVLEVTKLVNVPGETQVCAVDVILPVSIQRSQWDVNVVMTNVGAPSSNSLSLSLSLSHSS